MSITLHETHFFFQILEKILPNTLYYDNFDTYMDITNNQKKHIDYLNQAFMNNFKVKIMTPKFKFRFLKEFQINPFVSIEKKNEILKFFCLAQRAIFGFYKLSQLVKFKKSRHYEFECDLCLEPLSTLHPKFVIPIIQRNTLYKFRVHDLIRLIHNGLIYAPDLFSEPQIAKNPHTNLPFSVTDLYNIYFHLLKANMKVPILFNLYFLSNFDMTTLLDKYESVMRDESIKCNLKEMDNDDKYDEIMDMVDKYKRVMSSICIHTDFSQDKVVERFDHTLIHFMYSKYSYNPTFRLKHKSLLMIQLKKVNAESPTFGRIFVRLRRTQSLEIREPSLFRGTNDVIHPNHIFENINSFNSNLLEVISNIENNQHIMNNMPRAITNTSTSTSISIEDSEMSSVIENDDEIESFVDNNMDSFVDTLLNNTGLAVVGERIVSNSGRTFVHVPPVNEHILEPLPYPREEQSRLEQLTRLAQLAQLEIDNNNESDQISEIDVNSEMNSTIVSNQPYDETLDEFSDYDTDDTSVDDVDALADDVDARTDDVDARTDDVDDNDSVNIA